MTIGLRSIGRWALLLGVVLMASWDGRSATGQEKAQRRPPEPFRVFVQTSDPADAALKAQLEEAMPIVRERVERRRHWFRLAESAETADITLRVTNYRQGNPEDNDATTTHPDSAGWCSGREFHWVDAVVLTGEATARISGLDYRCIDRGPGLRNAASHLAEELERFAKANYRILSQLPARD